MQVVIVESPAKAKTINKYLGPDYEVIASYGHVRDLPSKDGSVDPDADFRMLWEVDPKAQKRLNEIAQAVKKADGLILATDPDREGEAISWHVLEILRDKKALKDQKVERVVFNAITKQAVLDAMRAPRAIDVALVDAYLARRALDYLVGFHPFAGPMAQAARRAVGGARPIGGAAPRLRPRTRDRDLRRPRILVHRRATGDAARRCLRGASFGGRRQEDHPPLGGNGGRGGGLPRGAECCRLHRGERGGEADAAPSAAAFHHFDPPAGSEPQARPRAGPDHATAQRLYEGVDVGGETVGLITYMRTDGVDMAPEAVAATRRAIGAQFGERYLPAFRANTRPRRRTRRKRTRRSAPPIRAARRPPWRAISIPSRRDSTI